MSGDPGDPDHLLVVEDNPGDVRLIEEALGEADLETTLHVVSDGESALDFVHKRGAYADAPAPDLVLVDWNLPQTDGQELLDRITDAVSDIVAVIMTGSEAKLDALKSETSTANAYMAKPTEPAAYVDAIRSVY